MADNKVKIELLKKLFSCGIVPPSSAGIILMNLKCNSAIDADVEKEVLDSFNLNCTTPSYGSGLGLLPGIHNQPANSGLLSHCQPQPQYNPQNYCPPNYYQSYPYCPPQHYFPPQNYCPPVCPPQSQSDFSVGLNNLNL
jgi:hypothetical protein